MQRAQSHSGDEATLHCCVGLLRPKDNLRKRMDLPHFGDPREAPRSLSSQPPPHQSDRPCCFRAQGTLPGTKVLCAPPTAGRRVIQ